ncbi:hypothetical protein ACI3LY_005442 [Candidozyma auris]|uniref:RRM domain-containing protein n=2 Tax=Candidozyma auris TaxID=498019 RepID=A0A2H0ZG55_CANAR|nr:hypothetical_protein [[Candida] auris]KND96055.2 hypothetical protein QG37_07679 [[Candida] auris]PIS49596.1 hypothetical protein B9J08_004620 [[Candida] auris]PIS50142.1 hypothetical protein CJI97_004832 [[Candida] auris]PSK77392.1 hypothetical protein CJJ07_002805 [[Candida] auris]QEL62457.1 hypothetical protein CJJ09_004633 [[Candida] auris]
METQSRTVFVASIPFDYTEEQVLDIAKSVGPVNDIKLIFDPTTGKSKGNAYISYGDSETAASAVRNLNNMNVGNRYLRCTMASDEDAQNQGLGGNAGKLPPLPLGVQLFPGQNAQQAISDLLTRLDSQTAGKLMKEAKAMSLENPVLMKKLLDQCPQLSHALVETSLMVNLANKNLVELCLNRRHPDLDHLTRDHVELLKYVNGLTEEELASLDADKRKVVKQIQNEISKGSYGAIET